MKIKRMYYKRLILGLLAAAGVFLLSGCGKKFYEYKCAWVSDDPYIYIPIDHTMQVVMEIDGVEYNFTSAWENDGSGMEICDLNIDGGLSQKSIVWLVSCKMKNDELYITVEKDNISDYEGKTIVLHQQPLEETTDEETDE